MIIVQLMGGMGNQMFQYALGKHLAILNQTQLKPDTSILLDWTPGRHAVNRAFDLNIFNVNDEWASKREISRYNSQLMNIPEKIIFKARKLFSGDAVLREKFYHFDADVLNARGEIYIAGLWQSYRYFESIEQEIRTAFQFRFPLSEKAAELYKRIKTVNTVCVNVRRTDYVNVASTANTMGTIPVDYYKKALDIITAKSDKPEVFIFSDDIAWCKEHLTIFNCPHFFVDHSYAGDQFSDYMQLMTACNHFIIPNSSFAWWAAWLNRNEDKVVIAPKQWMADTSVNTTDLIPNTWIRI